MPKAKDKKDGLTDTWGRKNRKIPDKTCEYCKKMFRPKNSKHKTCSKECGYKIRQLPQPLKNNGKGWKNKKGYIEIKIDGKTKKQHRHIMELHIGRKLESWEDVHHINQIKNDNRIENLEIVTHSQHSINHNQKKIYKKGYKLNLSDTERKRRADHLKMIKAKAAILKATTPTDHKQ